MRPEIRRAMPAPSGPNPGSPKPLSGALAALLLLALVLAPLFLPSLKPNHIVFSNDGPFGANSSAASAYPGAFTGVWQDLNWVGNESVSGTPSFTNLHLWLAGPKWFAKTYAFAALLTAGFAAWLFFRQLGFPQAVCILGGVAMALNGNRLSVACWGLASWVYSSAAVLLALAALVAATKRRPWILSALAGFATGMAVMEGFDTGALFSLMVAAYGVFLAWQQPGRTAANLLLGAGRLALVAACAGFIATQILLSLVGTQVKGVAGMAQDEATRRQRYLEATQWSLPKVETLRVVISGLFGYRMDTPDGGNYWGFVGRTPGWEEHKQGYARHSGSGEYAGVAVVLLAVFALAVSFRRGDARFSPAERRQVWFWGALALGSLLLAFGKHAPFHQLFYALPYASTIRNPVKFMHLFHVALVILFGFGLHALFKSVTAASAGHARAFLDHVLAWWEKLRGFDKNWTLALLGLAGVSIFTWLLYGAKRPGLEGFLATQGFATGEVTALAKFSIGEVGWFVLFLVLTVALVTVCLSGFFHGPRARLAAVLFGMLLFADLGRAATPWILYWDLRVKYASNPVLDFLKQNAHEHRVSIPPFPVPQMQLLQQLYGIEWTQHLFLRENIQSVDVTQEPRPLQENLDYRAALRAGATTLPRFWELTNTRYLLGLTGGGFLDALNQQLDGGRNRFRLHSAFNIVPKQPAPGGPMTLDKLTAVNDPNGQFAVIEFTGALPRAKLFTNWLATTNDAETLSLLASPAFNPHETVIVSGGLPAGGAVTTNATPGSVRFASYSPKRIVLEATATAPSVLLLNDKHNANWKVFVNGRPAGLLRCNYLMRGVRLDPGQHAVEFRYEPSTKALQVTVAAWLVCLGLLGFIAYDARAKQPSASSSKP